MLKVTIMIPTFNQSDFIREAIDSALSQNYPNLEVVVGDDASTDNTRQIVEKINDPRLRYIRNINNLGRVGNYKNLLYNHASGDYIVNLDGDDYYTDPSFIAEAIKLIDCDLNIVIVSARTTRKFKNKKYVANIRSSDVTNGMKVLRNLPNSKYLFQHMATLYNRNEALKIDFYRASTLSSDWESLYRLALRGNIRYMDRNVGVWRLHDANESGTADLSKHFENQATWLSVFKESVRYGMNPFLAKYLCSKCIAFSTQWACCSISKKGNAELTKFIFSIFSTYKFAALITIFSPTYMIRLLLCYIGYYR